MGWQLIKTLQSVPGLQTVRGYRGELRYFQILYVDRPTLDIANVGRLIIAGGTARDINGSQQLAVQKDWAIWYTRQQVDLDGTDTGAPVLYFVGRRSPFQNETVEFWNYY